MRLVGARPVQDTTWPSAVARETVLFCERSRTMLEETVTTIEWVGTAAKQNIASMLSCVKGVSIFEIFEENIMIFPNSPNTFNAKRVCSCVNPIPIFDGRLWNYGKVFTFWSIKHIFKILFHQFEFFWTRRFDESSVPITTREYDKHVPVFPLKDSSLLLSLFCYWRFCSQLQLNRGHFLLHFPYHAPAALNDSFPREGEKNLVHSMVDEGKLNLWVIP